MKTLSRCHEKPVTRTRNGPMACSSCGRYSAPFLKMHSGIEMENKGNTSEGFVFTNPKISEIDNRDAIRHLKSEMKFTACGKKGHRTTDKSRVNCVICMRTEMYKKYHHGPGLVGKTQ